MAEKQALIEPKDGEIYEGDLKVEVLSVELIHHIGDVRVATIRVLEASKYWDDFGLRPDNRLWLYEVGPGEWEDDMMVFKIGLQKNADGKIFLGKLTNA